MKLIGAELINDVGICYEFLTSYQLIHFMMIQVINDRKESMWGNDISVPLSTLPLMFGKTSCTLVIQINQEVRITSLASFTNIPNASLTH